MSGLNKCSFIGNLGKDPEMRFTGAGEQVAAISIGVNSQWKDRLGVQQKHTEWISCSAFGKLAEIIGKYLKKGAHVYVEGRQRTEKFQKDGQDRYSTKIVLSTMLMLDSKPQANTAGQPSSDDRPVEFNDLEIPF